MGDRNVHVCTRERTGQGFVSVPKQQNRVGSQTFERFGESHRPDPK